MKRPPFDTFKNPTCKGSFALGTACGTCEKCLWEKAQPEYEAVMARIQKREPDGMGCIAFVTVTIPVNLHFDGPASWDEIHKAALENFLDHPAFALEYGGMGMNIAPIAGFVDRIEVTHES